MADTREKLIEIIENAGSLRQYPGSMASILIENGVTVQKWIPVTERLPKKETFVLFLYAKDNKNPTLHAKNTMAVGRLSHKMFIVDGCAVKVTHWMPLPEPPEETSQ